MILCTREPVRTHCYQGFYAIRPVNLPVRNGAIPVINRLLVFDLCPPISASPCLRVSLVSPPAGVKMTVTRLQPNVYRPFVHFQTVT